MPGIGVLHSPIRYRKLAVIVLALLASLLSACGTSDVENPGVDATDAPEISFSANVMPILERDCVRCHGAGRASGGVMVDSYTNIMAGANGQAIVVPGKAASSILVDVLVTGAMPRGAARLSDADIETIRAWVDAGAPDN